MPLAPLNPADDFDAVAGGEVVAEVLGEEVAVADIDAVDPDDSLAVLMTTALEAAMTPPPTVLGALAFALAAADL